MISRLQTARPLAALLALAAAAPASAQFWRGGGQGGTPTDQVPAVLEEVRIEEKLGARVPLDAVLRDDQGRPVQLGSLFKDGKPVVLALVYYDCPMLCGLVQSGLARAMRENGLTAGRDFKAVSLSFAPDEKPALARERRRGYLQSMGLDESSPAWSFWVDRGGAAKRVGEAVGRGAHEHLHRLVRLRTARTVVDDDDGQRVVGHQRVGVGGWGSLGGRAVHGRPA